MKSLVLCGACEGELRRMEKLLWRVAERENAAMKSILLRPFPGAEPALHVRFGRAVGAVSPEIPLGQADAIVSVDPGQLLKNLRQLKKDGIAAVYADCAQRDPETGYDPERCIAFLVRRVKHVCILRQEEEKALLEEKMLRYMNRRKSERQAVKSWSRESADTEAQILKRQDTELWKLCRLLEECACIPPLAFL